MVSQSGRKVKKRLLNENNESNNGFIPYVIFIIDLTMVTIKIIRQLKVLFKLPLRLVYKPHGFGQVLGVFKFIQYVVWLHESGLS